MLLRQTAACIGKAVCVLKVLLQCLYLTWLLQPDHVHVAAVSQDHQQLDSVTLCYHATQRTSLQPYSYSR